MLDTAADRRYRVILALPVDAATDGDAGQRSGQIVGGKHAEQVARVDGIKRFSGGILGAVMGVAGATSGQEGVLLAGLAGLLAGALSMALGEWISVKSSQELYENQMQIEMEELENSPENEMKELELIYKSKGIPEAQAKEMAASIMNNTEEAHELLVREELGINAEELKGSAFEAALYSFFLFAVGAIIPVFPFMFLSGTTAILVSTAASAVGLFIIGSAITLFTGKNIWFSGFRQVIFGLAAAAITFGIGKLIGVSVAG